MPKLVTRDLAKGRTLPLQERQLPSDLFSRPERIRLRSTPTYDHLFPAADPVKHAAIVERKATIVVLPETYYGLNAGPAPGTVVGIVLGTVLGFFLVLWLVWILTQNTATDNYIEGDEIDINISRRGGSRSHRTRTHRSTHRSTHHSAHQSEMSDRRSQSTRQPSPRRRTERIIVEETRRTTSRAPPPPRSASSMRETERISVHVDDDRRVDGDDVVEVIEERSEASAEPPRRKSKKSGFRTVDPNEYAGGNFPQQHIDRNRSRR